MVIESEGLLPCGGGAVLVRYALPGEGTSVMRKLMCAACAAVALWGGILSVRDDQGPQIFRGPRVPSSAPRHRKPPFGRVDRSPKEG